MHNDDQINRVGVTASYEVAGCEGIWIGRDRGIRRE